jgi:hypothetical protein
MLQDPRVLVLAERGDGYELRDGIDRLPLEVVLEIERPLPVLEAMIGRLSVRYWKWQWFLARELLTGLSGQGGLNEPSVCVLRARRLAHSAPG